MVTQTCKARRNCSGHGTRHWYSAAQLPESEYCGKIFRRALTACFIHGLVCGEGRQAASFSSTFYKQVN